ncbi:MAG TPA: SMP-30/gluconolactonase/LRE family protein [Thermomicrobiales bacterium]|nr:SMP-30/gluconolactonase/LRE family protein [Thermomicrobiales bacterium]
MRVSSSLTQLIAGYDSPEGPAIDREGNLFFVNWLSSSIVKLSPDGDAGEFFNTGGIPAGLAFHRDGSLYVADEGDDIHGVIRITPDGQVSTVVDQYDGRPLNGANDLVFDAAGILYFSDPWRSSVERPTGGFYRCFPDRRLERLDHGLAFPNGVAVNAEGTAVFLAETGHNRILRYRLHADGSVGSREVFAELTGGPGPDGMAFDEAGDLYVAHHGEGRVDVIDPAGRVVEEIPVPGSQPTNVAFIGPDRKTLVVTEVETGSLYPANVAVAGQRLFSDLVGPGTD